MNNPNPDSANTPAVSASSRGVDGNGLASQSVPVGSLGGIPQVNQEVAASAKEKRTKVLIILGTVILAVALIFGLRAGLNAAKTKLKASTTGQRADAETAQAVVNPQATMHSRRPRALGSSASAPSPGSTSDNSDVIGRVRSRSASADVAVSTQGGSGCETIPGAKALREANGRIVTSGAGRAMCVGADGRVIEVPAIRPAAAGTVAASQGPQGGQTNAAANPASQARASKFAGSLFADGANAVSRVGSAAGGQPRVDSSRDAASGGAGAVQGMQADDSAADGGRARVQQATLEAIRSISARAGQNADQAPAGAGSGPAAQAPYGSQATQAARSASAPSSGLSPVAQLLQSGSGTTADASTARVSRESSFVLPKASQIDCVLTTRVINEVPGLTSCTITHDLYGSDGRVKLVEKGSVLDGEYGNATQGGQRRLFVLWNRLRTPTGVTVNLRSPGTDTLGTSGLPGHLEQRWAERIGTALLISTMHDLIALQAARAAARSGTNAIVAGQSMQSTRDATQSIVEQVVRSSMQTRPTLYINEGERIAVYVAQDVNFEGVYRLRLAGSHAAGGQ